MRARRAARVLLGLGMLVWSAVLVLYGLFAVVYAGDGGGDAYVGVGGRDVDADVVGGVTLALALALALLALLALRTRGR